MSPAPLPPGIENYHVVEAILILMWQPGEVQDFIRRESACYSTLPLLGIVVILESCEVWKPTASSTRL
jgi:hypothetical protein